MFVFRLVDTLVAKADVRVHYQRADRSIILNASTGQPYARVVPDILVERRADATTRLAIDAKYKLYDERRLSSGDVYQSFLYAYAYGDTSGQTLPTALVVYPSSVGGSQEFDFESEARKPWQRPKSWRSVFRFQALSPRVMARTQRPATKALAQGIQQGLFDTKPPAA